MNQFNAGEQVWYNFEGRDRVYRIVEIKGNVAILESYNTTGPKENTEAYLSELKPYAPCTNTNVIGRSSCDIRRPNHQ